MRSITPLRAFTGVAASSTAYTKLDRNRRVHGIILQYKTNAAQATVEADITAIRVKVNQRTVREFSAAQLNLINALNGISFQLGLIPIWFSEPKRRTPEGEELLSWLIYEQLGIGDLEIEVDIGSGAVSPTLTGTVIWDNQLPISQTKDPMLRSAIHWVRKVVPCSAAGTVTPGDHFPAVNGFLHRLHAFDAVVTGVSLKAAETEFYNQTTVNMLAHLNAYGMTKQASTFSAVLDHTQQYVDGLYIPSVPYIRADYTASGAASGNQFTVIQEIRRPFDLG